MEDAYLYLALKDVLLAQKSTVLVEAGCGTGRFLLRSLEKTLMDELYVSHLHHIVGVDFSMKMIERSIDNIAKYIPHLVTASRIDEATAQRTARDRILFINADFTKPFLRVEGDALTVVGMMFGTLGNIPPQHRQLALHVISGLIERGGEAILTVFDAEFNEVGLESYREIKNLVGERLKWEEPTKTFVTLDKGFYSHWFQENEFLDLLQKSKFTEILEETRFGKRGIAVRATTRGGKQGILGIKQRGRAKLWLQCPNGCPEALSLLYPSPRERSLSCKRCSSRFEIIDVNGFRIPVLLQ